MKSSVRESLKADGAAIRAADQTVSDLEDKLAEVRSMGAYHRWNVGKTIVEEYGSARKIPRPVELDEVIEITGLGAHSLDDSVSVYLAFSDEAFFMSDVLPNIPTWTLIREAAHGNEDLKTFEMKTVEASRDRNKSATVMQNLKKKTGLTEDEISSFVVHRISSKEANTQDRVHKGELFENWIPHPSEPKVRVRRHNNIPDELMLNYALELYHQGLPAEMLDEEAYTQILRHFGEVTVAVVKLSNRSRWDDLFGSKIV